MGTFSNAQGQLTPQSVIRSGLISNSYEILCMSWLPASIKWIGIKNSREKVATPFSPIITLIPMEAICYYGNMSSDPIGP